MSEKPAPVALSTQKPNNRFDQKIYVSVTPEGTLIPLQRKQKARAAYIFKLVIEYPPYEIEQKIRKEAQLFDERHGAYVNDYEKLTEERVRHCLVRWDLNEQLPELFPPGSSGRLHRERGILSDDSIDYWKNLPPLLRKFIGSLINEAIGGL